MGRIRDYIANIKPDKMLHFIAGVVISQILFLAFMTALNPVLASICSFFGTVIVGASKELIDKNIGGVGSVKDFVATVIGAIPGTLLALLICTI